MLGKLWLKWRHVPWWMRWLAYGITPIILFYVVEDLRGWWAWKSYRDQWEAAGDRFELKHHLPDPIPDEENFAATPFIQELYQNEGRFEKPARVWELWQEPEYRPDSNVYRPLCRDFPFETLFEEGLFTRTEAITETLRKFEAWNPIIDELAAAAKRPSCDYPIDWTVTTVTNGEPRIHHWSALITVARALKIRSLARLHSDDPAGALSDIEIIFDLRRHASADGSGSLIDQTFILAALHSIWEGIRMRAWSHSELELLQERLGELKPSRRFAESVLVGRALTLQEIDRLANNPLDRFEGWEPKFLLLAGSFWTKNIDSSHSWFFRFIAPRGWHWQNKATLCRSFESTLADRPWNPEFRPPDAPSSFDPAIDFARDTPYNFLARKITAGFLQMSRKLSGTETTIDLARVAIAAERYRITRGDYPDAIADLAPEFIDRIPVDRCSKSGELVRYQRRPDGTIAIYSVGPNDTDDGARPHFKSNRGDIAWQYSLPPGFTAKDYRK